MPEPKRSPGAVAITVGFFALLLLVARLLVGPAPEAKTGESAPSSTEEVRHDRTLSDQPGCLTERDFLEFRRHLGENDQTGALYLMQEGRCDLIRAGIQASVLDESVWSNWVKVRLYGTKGATQVYLPRRAIYGPP